MKRFSAAEARQRFSQVLDEAERGEGVVIERRGVTFEIRPLRRARATTRRQSCLVVLDAAVKSGQWTWGQSARGLEFLPRRGEKK